MAANPANDSIWRQMNYTPPRGPCNHKDSLLSPKCPCLRFMLHPLKISSSFTCDGCDHHASFHSMSSPADDTVMARWAKEAKDQEITRKRKENGQAISARKRRQLLSGLASMDLHTERASSDNVINNINNSRAIEWNVDGANRRRARSASPASEASDTGAGATNGLRISSNSSRTWGERFTSWRFGSVEPEPEKTPPKKALQTPAATSTATTTEPQGSKVARRIAVPKSQITAKKVAASRE